MQVEKADMRELRALRLKCEGYLEGVNVVQSRIEMAVGLVSVENSFLSANRSFHEA